MPSSQPMSALESLRTVEFRQTLRGYHIDDVDEYLERVAVEAEALQEQLRQSSERLRQATDRIAQLEHGGDAPSAPAAAQASTTSAEESLQRTLQLAQKFVEQTEAEAQAQARAVVAEAQQQARQLVGEAEERARLLSEESEKRLREEVARLEALRAKLVSDVDTISRHLEGERARLRGALGEMLHWIDENLQGSATKPLSAPSADQRPRDEAPAGALAGAGRQGLQPVGPPNAPNGTPPH
jgi:cell division initiation protein